MLAEVCKNKNKQRYKKLPLERCTNLHELSKDFLIYFGKIVENDEIVAFAHLSMHLIIKKCIHFGVLHVSLTRFFYLNLL